jgi:uncharacterized membrane protein YphA (DoxX/SURF4 family)
MKTTGYWISTIILTFAIASGGAAELARQPETIEGMTRLGYPVYFVTILGIWKELGAIVLLVPRFPRLKEWAYAGIFFDMTGAAVSHAVCRDATWHVVVTGAFAIITLISWALRPQDRMIGVFSPVRAL